MRNIKISMTEAAVTVHPPNSEKACWFMISIRKGQVQIELSLVANEHTLKALAAIAASISEIRSTYENMIFEIDLQEKIEALVDQRLAEKKD